MLLVADAPVKARKQKHKKTKRVRRLRSVNVVRLHNFVGRIRPKYCDTALLTAVLVLCVLGVFFVYSASKYNAEVYYGNAFYYVTKQVIGLFLGIIGLTVFYFTDYRALQKYAYIIYAAAVILLACVFIPGIGLSKLGANRWIGIGGFSVQPSEIAKFAFVIAAAKIFSRAGVVTGAGGGTGGGGTSAGGRISVPTLRQTLAVIAAGGIVCGLIILEPNMSITMCVGIVLFIMLFLCGVRLKTLAFIIVPAAAAVVLMLIAEPYRLKRLSAFIDPWATPKDEGFQLIQSLYAIGNGGLFGVGFGRSVQKFMFLPFSESDFVFSIIAEEFGLFGCLALFLIFAYIIYKIFTIGKAARDYFGRYLCYGIGTVIFVQSALNFAVATGCIPPTGLPLPFISFGGTSLLVFMSVIGIVLNIDKNNKRLQFE
jgi:cell division protein FtsW